MLGFVKKEDREKPGEQEKCRRYRRLIMRYTNVAVVETLRSMCIKAAERFPNYEKLVKSRKYIYLIEVYYQLLVGSIDGDYFLLTQLWAGAPAGGNLQVWHSK